MDSLGEYLKRIRESKNIPLKDMAVKTKISLSYLNAIEKNRFDDLPGEVFTKGFLRSCARFLGVDEADVINRYNQMKNQSMKTAPLENKTEEIVKKAEAVSINARKVAPIIGSAAVVFLIILAILFFRKEGPDKKVEKQVDKKIKTEKAAEKPKDVAAAPVQALNKKEAEPPAPQPKTEMLKKENRRLTLIVNAVEQSWLMITIDDKEKKDMLLQSGERISLKAEKNFLLTLGNAGGVDIEFNGKRLEPFGPKGRVVSNILLTGEKIRRKKTEAPTKEAAPQTEKQKEEKIEAPSQNTATQ